MIGLALLAGCGAPAPLPDGAVTITERIAGHELAGTWAWIHTEVADGAVTRERERWTFAPTPDPDVMAGHYHRTVEVAALDGVPFVCAQRPAYQLHADHELRVILGKGGPLLDETTYQVRSSPCDPGLRQLTRYVAELHRDRVVLRWPGGEQELVRIPDDDDFGREPTPPAGPVAPAGRWTWTLTSWTREGLVRDEAEDWELAAGAGGTLAGTYRREVTVRSPDGAPIRCAGAPSYRFVDRYLVRGVPDDEGGWRLEETAVAAGAHPCLAATPTRALDSAVAELDGDYLALVWRGKRKQILARP